MPLVSPSINRRNLMAGLGALAVGKGAAVSARNTTAPNIVLIVADDLGLAGGNVDHPHVQVGVGVEQLL